MKTVPVALALSIVAMGAAPLFAQQKTITLYVWLDEGVPANQEKTPARVEATRSLRLANSGQRFRQKFEFIPPNKYVLKLENAPKSIDIGIDLKNCHSLALCDLTGDQDHSLHVRLFSLQMELAAPECFALKTQYEFLFRREQQLAPPVARVDDDEARREAGEARRKAVQHVARLKYADGLLALPNPNRPEKTQSPKTQAMLAQMERDDEDGYNELENMVDGLFDLYDMGGFEQYVPSQWESVYFAGDRRISADVEILGTHGTYRTRDGVHLLENLDFINDNDEGGYIITGNFRFKPGTPDERKGEIRWKVDEQGFRETRSQGPNGQPSWSGKLLSGPYFPE